MTRKAEAKKAEKLAVIERRKEREDRRNNPEKYAPKKEEQKASKNVAPKKEEPKAPLKADPKDVKKPDEKKVSNNTDSKQDENAKVRRNGKILDIPEIIPKNEGNEILDDNEFLRPKNAAIPDKKTEDKTAKKEDKTVKAEDKIVIKDDAEDKTVKKGEKAAKKPAKENPYTKYMLRHTGENKGTTQEKLVDDLTKVYTAHLLENAKQKFSASQVDDFMDSIRVNLLLDDLNKNDLEACLVNPKEAIKKAESIRTDLYKIEPADYDNYVKDLQKLLDNMKNSKGRSTEYKDLETCVKRAAELPNKEFSSEEAKAGAYMQSAFLVTFAITNYTKGKKSVRTFEGGRERFDNALDAASIVTKYAKNSNKRIDQIVDRINVVRNDKKHPVRLEDYGAKRAEEYKKAKEEAKNKPKKDATKDAYKKQIKK